MAAEMALVKPISKFIPTTPKFGSPKSRLSYPKFTTIKMTATSQPTTPKPSKKAAKTAPKETLLAPRFYTTDFDEMEALFNTEINKNLNQAEFEALLQEFKTDYNQTHFVRNKEFKEAADKMQGPLRQIFAEFLERSCTAEFSGFLLYKELGIGLNTKEFDMHVIIETNGTTARVFPAVLDVENPEFKRKLDRMVEINEKLIAVGQSEESSLVKNFKRIPLVAALVSELLAAYLMPPIESGSVDIAEFDPQLVY